MNGPNASSKSDLSRSNSIDSAAAPSHSSLDLDITTARNTRASSITTPSSTQAKAFAAEAGQGNINWQELLAPKMDVLSKPIMTPHEKATFEIFDLTNVVQNNPRFLKAKWIFAPSEVSALSQESATARSAPYKYFEKNRDIRSSKQAHIMATVLKEKLSEALSLEEKFALAADSGISLSDFALHMSPEDIQQVAALKIAKLGVKLPLALLKIISLCQKVAAYEQNNNMGLPALAECLAPCLLPYMDDGQESPFKPQSKKVFENTAKKMMADRLLQWMQNETVLASAEDLTFEPLFKQIVDFKEQKRRLTKDIQVKKTMLSAIQKTITEKKQPLQDTSLPAMLDEELNLYQNTARDLELNIERAEEWQRTRENIQEAIKPVSEKAFLVMELEKKIKNNQGSLARLYTEKQTAQAKRQIHCLEQELKLYKSMLEKAKKEAAQDSSRWQSSHHAFGMDLSDLSRVSLTSPPPSVSVTDATQISLTDFGAASISAAFMDHASISQRETEETSDQQTKESLLRLLNNSETGLKPQLIKLKIKLKEKKAATTFLQRWFNRQVRVEIAKIEQAISNCKKDIKVWERAIREIERKERTQRRAQQKAQQGLSFWQRLINRFRRAE